MLRASQIRRSVVENQEGLTAAFKKVKSKEIHFPNSTEETKNEKKENQKIQEKKPLINGSRRRIK